jgi:N6-adenosine-specific RNA methylase IME4
MVRREDSASSLRTHELPWKYNSRKAGGERKNKTKFGGGAEKHYSLMSDEEIFGLAPLINKIAAPNCALFLWSVCPKLDVGIQTLRTWGFRFCTVAFIWRKTTKDGSRLIYGPGYYTGSNAEQVLLGVRGSMRPVEKMIDQDVTAPRGEHSKKPEEVNRRISLMYPYANKLELFATRPLHGWVTTGLNAPDGLEVTTSLQMLANGTYPEEFLPTN